MQNIFKISYKIKKNKWLDFERGWILIVYLTYTCFSFKKTAVL